MYSINYITIAYKHSIGINKKRDIKNNKYQLMIDWEFIIQQHIENGITIYNDIFENR